MKTIYLLVFACIFCTSTFAQRRTNQRSQQNMQQPVDPEKEQARYEEQAEKQKQEYIAEFVATLEVDDFQKEIITQQMDSYFEELRKINRMGLKSFERTEHVDKLDVRHFADVRAIVTEDTMNKIMDALKGNWDRKSEKKKKKRNRKNKN